MRTCGTVSTVMVLCLVAQSSAIIEYRATIARGNRLTVRPSAGLKLPQYDVNTPLKGLSHGILSYFEHRKNNR